MTPLDQAYAAMEADPEDANARLRFYDRLAAAELFLMLSEEAQGDAISPEVFETAEGAFVLAFDTEERLGSFSSRIVPYAALSGRVLSTLLAQQGLGLALNPDVAPSAFLMPTEAMQWLAATTSESPEEMQARPRRLSTPVDLPEALIDALSGRLASVGALARRAWLAGVEYEGGGRGHLLGIAGAEAFAHAALSRTVQEALVFSGLEAGALDVVFLSDSDTLAAELARVGLRFDIPQPAAEQRPSAPGMNPDSPPRLR